MITFDRKIGGVDHFKIMVDLMGRDVVCDFLEIHRTTLTRILEGKSKLPRAYLLALYWETPWGRSVVDSHNHFERQLLHRAIERHESDIAALERSIEKLVEEAKFMSANTPVYRIKARQIG